MSITDPSTSVQAVKYTYEPYRVSVEEYVPCAAKLPQPPASHTSRGKSMSMMGDDSGLLEYVIMPLFLIVWLVEAIREAGLHLLLSNIPSRACFWPGALQ